MDDQTKEDILEDALNVNADPRMLKEELDLIMNYCREHFKGGDTLELGAYKGMTSFCLASIHDHFESKAKHYIVDIFSIIDGDQSWGYEEHTKQMLIDNVARYADYIDVTEGYSTDNPVVEKIISRKYDYIWIDGDHRAGTLYLELLMTDLLSDHVFLHDYGHTGVTTAVDRFCAERGYTVKKWDDRYGLAEIVKSLTE